MGNPAVVQTVAPVAESTDGSLPVGQFTAIGEQEFPKPVNGWAGKLEPSWSAAIKGVDSTEEETSRPTESLDDVGGVGLIRFDPVSVKLVNILHPFF